MKEGLDEIEKGNTTSNEEGARRYLEQGRLSLSKSFDQHLSSCLKIRANNLHIKKSGEKPRLREYVVQKYLFLIFY